MYPNMNNPQHPSAPYPPQPGYNMGGPSNQQPPYGNQMPYGSTPGAAGPGNYQPNMSAPFGNPQGMFGGIGTPYGQSGNPGPGNPYGASTNPHGGNPYGQNTYPPQGGNNMPGSGYPAPTHQTPYGGNPYGQNAGGYGPGGYPSGASGYPPQTGGYPSQPGGYPVHPGGYPPQGGQYPGQQPGYPPHSGYGAPGMGPNAGGFPPQGQRLNQVIQQYEINPQFASRLQALANCEIVVLCDDSGSMNATLQGTNKTRWDELKSIVSIVVDIAATMDSNGVDVYFLNRDPVPNVTNGQNVRHIFQRPPDGMTPLVRALRQILQAKRNLTYEKKLLILIATDGVPTNDFGQQDVAGLEVVLRQERTPQTYVSFLACTDDLQSVNYLSQWDKSMPNLDVIDDYASERAEILRTRGPSFPFSFGDYIVKALLGSIDPWFDSLDDRA